MSQNITELICDTCTVRFLNEEEYCVHAISCKKNGKIKVICAICREEKSAKYFKHHIVLHQGVYNHTCELCSSIFNTKAKLNNHLSKYHSNLLRFQCDICHEQFSINNDLKNHKSRKHTDRPTLNCGYPGCSYSSKIKYSLQVHYRRHTGEKPFKCDECGKTFSQKRLLINHHTQKHPTPSFQFDEVAADSNHSTQLEDSLPVLTNEDLIAELGIDTEPSKVQTDLVEDTMEPEVTFDDGTTTELTIEFLNY